VLQEAEELLVAVPPLALGEHLAGADVERREERGRAVPHVAVGDALDVAEAHRTAGCARSSAWIWLFSSTQRTSALSGGFR
jgi:hypothetical protein